MANDNETQTMEQLQIARREILSGVTKLRDNLARTAADANRIAATAHQCAVEVSILVDALIETFAATATLEAMLANPGG